MNKETIRIYFNPRCSKCREAAALVDSNLYHIDYIEYLKTPPDKEALRGLLAKLNMQPQELIRKGEDVFKQDYAGRSLSDEEWLEAMVAHPVLIERPIMVRGDRAVVARPPGKALKLL